MPAQPSRGRFVWHELMTTDPDAAVRFYGKVVGWKTESWSQDPSYRMWLAGSTPVGGVMHLPEEARRGGAPSHWLTYVGVPDVDASVRQAKSLGARALVEPSDIPGAGRFAVLGDPQGAAFAVYTSSQPPGAEATIGGFSWHELATTDPKRAWDFYRTLFGWKKTSSFDMGPAGEYLMFGLGGQPMGGLYQKPLEMPVSSWLPYVQVKSADDVAVATGKHGGRVLTGPMEVPGGDRITTGLDPQGAAFAVHWKAVVVPAPPTAKAKPKVKAKAKAKTKAKPRARAKARPKAKARKTRR